MFLYRLPCRLKAHVYVSQPLGHVLTNTHTHTAIYMCADDRTNVCIYALKHSYMHISGFRASKQSHEALQHEHTHPCALF